MPNNQVQTYIENPFFDHFFGSSEPVVENLSLNLFVYDLNEVLVQYIEDIPGKYWNIDANILYHDLYDTLIDNNIYSGNYKIKYSIFNNIFGNSNKKLYIKDISDSRYEFRIVPSLDIFTEAEIIHFSALSKTDTKNNFFTFYLKTDNDELIQVVNFLPEVRTTAEPKYSFIVKLDTPASDSIVTNDKVFLTIALNQEEFIEINIIPTNNEKTAEVLQSPDFSIKVNKKINESMDYKNWTDLISQNDYISRRLTGKYLSSGSFGVDLNVDFRQFENFIFFSSAEKRLDTFKYKLTNIEEVDNSIQSLYSVTSGTPSVTGSGEFINNIIKFKNKKTEIIKSFDFYETYLYYASSSYESSSFGEFDSMSWPKMTSGSFFIPYSVTSSIAEDWYSGILYSASLYDRQNDNALTKYIPEFIIENELNSNYNTFVQATAHLFDNIWIYIKAQEDLYLRDESLYVGIVKDLIYSQLKSFGWDSINDNQFDDLWYYAVGTNETGLINATGSYSVNEQMITASTEMTPYGDITKEFWKRILNNLPHLFKSKGTKEGIRSLINCYGIPPTILRIKEFGGPEKIPAKSYYQYDKFTYAIDFNQTSGSYIEVVKGPLMFTDKTPESIEFRFRTINASAYPTGLPSSLKKQCIYRRNDGKIMFALTHTIGNNGTFDVYMSNGLKARSNEGPFFNGDWWGFLFRHNESNQVITNTHTFDLFVKQAKWFDISYEFSSSFTLYGSGSDSVDLDYWFEENSWEVGSSPIMNTYNPFHGQIQEFRYWANPITEDQFDNHVMAPTSIYSTDSFDNLGLRFPLGTDLKIIDSTVSQSIYSKHPNYNITTFSDLDGELSGSFIFNSSPIEIPFVQVVDYYSLEYPDISSNRFISNKVRVEANSLTKQLDLNHSYDQAEFDLYPIDTNKFGVYFSPTDEINEDIAEQYGGFKIDNYIGGWNNYFSSSYDGLKALNNDYNKKFEDKFNVKDYIRLTEFYNNSLFNHIYDNTPARARKLLGVVIEPHLLNRSKVAFAGSEPEYKQLENSGLVDYTFGEMDADYNYTSLQRYYYNSVYDISGLTETIQTQLSDELSFWNIVEQIGDSEFSSIMDQRLSANKYEYSRVSGSYGNQFTRKAPVQDYISPGMYQSFYSGCKISSTSINSPTSTSIDGKAVVETFVNNTNALIVKENTDGLLIAV